MESVSITPELAQEIADALNETHERACATTRKQIEAYKEALKALDANEDKVHDSLYEGILDRESFKRQVERVRTERLNLTTQLEKAQLNLNGAYKETAKSILELATNAKSL